jgi:hypothetical protein
MASPNNVNQTLIEEFRAKGGKVIVLERVD